jgi:hypothetical protein
MPTNSCCRVHCRITVVSASATTRTSVAQIWPWSPRDRPVDRCQVHGATMRAAVTRLEDLPSQSRLGYRRYRFVRLNDSRLQAAVWPGDHPSRATPPGLDQRHNQPDGRMDRPPDHRSLPLGPGATLPHPRQRRLLRRHGRKEDSGDGHPRSTNRTPLALAERTHRTAHRLNRARMPGPRRGSGRSAPSPDP